MLLCCMKTIRDVFDDYKTMLNNIYEKNEVDSITLLLINEVTGISKANIKAFPKHELTDDQAGTLAGYLTKLQTGMPVQYVSGKTEFYGLSFLVNSSVLIPRPETEELVEWVIEAIDSEQRAVDSGQLSVRNILDIGTGSGCIAISLKKHLPDFTVSAIDISPEAINTARLNAKVNHVDIEFIEADILNFKLWSPISHPKSQISLIVSNPPYVTPTDKSQMHNNVINFEPHSALFVPEDDPLLFYKAIADFAQRNLEENGLLFLEINESYGKQTVEMLSLKGFKYIELRQDLSGRDRMIKAAKN